MPMFVHLEIDSDVGRTYSVGADLQVGPRQSSRS